MSEETAKKKAAEALAELSVKVEQGYEEIVRMYEIVSVLHAVAKMYLDAPMPDMMSDDEVEAYHWVIDAVAALENNMTLEQARIVREEETEE